jgi:(p)ppGpp synthase/HD superfamily hydrolase
LPLLVSDDGRMTLWSQDAWHDAWELAAEAHLGQTLPGQEIPYLSHIGAVAMEVSWAIAARTERHPVAQPTLAIQCALLHDVVEDTALTIEQIAQRFGDDVARGVAALTKNPAVGDKPAQMRDSLERIRQCPPEVWMVKLADRIHNLREPPHYWSAAKIRGYCAARGYSKESRCTLNSRTAAVELTDRRSPVPLTARRAYPPRAG